MARLESREWMGNLSSAIHGRDHKMGISIKPPEIHEDQGVYVEFLKIGHVVVQHAHKLGTDCFEQRQRTLTKKG
jgi:hypothetical protein